MNKNEVIQKMETLHDGARLSLRLSPTVGAGVVIIELNPARNEKGQKKYLMWWGEDEAKAKIIAAWVADRAPQWAV